jgi:hypothetical protein
VLEDDGEPETSFGIAERYDIPVLSLSDLWDALRSPAVAS